MMMVLMMLAVGNENDDDVNMVLIFVNIVQNCLLRYWFW